MSDRTVAAVDIGTNSTRLLVQRAGRDLERRTVITRLGQGVDRTGRFDPEAVARTVEVLRTYREVMDGHGVQAVRVVSTSAARDVQDRDAFLDSVADVLGAAPEILPGDEEGRLAFAGATAGLDTRDGPYLVVDIGGGSTEFVVGAGGEATGVLSVDMGSVRLTEQHLHGDPPAPEELSNALAVVESHMEDVLRELPAVRDARRVIGVAGTITTVAAVEIGLLTYDRDRIHHFSLTREAAEDVFRTLATERLADRIHNPGLERARADVIVGGCCVLVGILRHLDLPGLLVSETDLLDGLAASLQAP